MSCFQCNTSALFLNEVILPVSFTLFFVLFSFYAIRKIFINQHKRDAPIKNQYFKISLLILFYILGIWISLKIGPLDIMDANFYSDRM